MAKLNALPRGLRGHLEHTYGKYDDMVITLIEVSPFVTSQRVYECMASVNAINKVLNSCGDKMREFAERALLRPEGTADEVAVEMGMPKGRGRRWKSMLLYGLACARGYINEEFDKCMVEENPSTGRIYGIWSGMIQRCYNPNGSGYDNYGGRGIRVCDRWLHSYYAFEKWARANGYRDNLTIDRIDNDGDYSPENCRWATRKQQQNNRRNNVFVKVKGVKMTVAEAADKYGVPRDKAYWRARKGWTGDEVVYGRIKKQA